MSSKANLAFSLLGESDIPELVEFQNEYFPDKRNPASFKHHYLLNRDEKGLYVLGKINGVIISAMGLYPFFFENKEGTYLKTGKSEDVLVHPAYRGQGLSIKMYKKLFQEAEKLDYQLVWGFSHLRPQFFHRAGIQVARSSRLLIYKPNLVKQFKFVLQSSLWSFPKRLVGFIKTFNLRRSKSRGFIKLPLTRINVEEYMSINGSNSSIFKPVPDAHFPLRHQFFKLEDKTGKPNIKFALDLKYRHACFISDFQSFGKLEDIPLDLLYHQLSTKYGYLIFWAFQMESQQKLIQKMLTIGFKDVSQGVNLVWKNLLDSDLNPDEFSISRLMALHR